jgi:hypothetical protein
MLRSTISLVQIADDIACFAFILLLALCYPLSLGRHTNKYSQSFLHADSWICATLTQPIAKYPELIYQPTY